MNYKQTLEYINKIKQRGVVLGLDNMKKMCQALESPQNIPANIHIAGTNGKGSVGAMLEGVLGSSGYRCGHYSSPQVIDYRDRWSINGEIISEEELADIATRLKEISEKIGCEPTVFEFETLIAFEWFVERECDFAVIECGMGGKGDATNVIDNKLMAVFTPIAMDHSAFLGNTIEEIAREKAGIITGDCRVISAQQTDEARKALLESAEGICFVDDSQIDNISLELDKTSFCYKGEEFVISLLGKFQCRNAALAIEACRIIQELYPEKRLNIYDGLKNTHWRCRFQLVSEEPPVIIDAAHNPHGAMALRESVELYLADKSIAFIMGVFADKDYESEARIIAPLGSMVYTVTAQGERALAAERLAETVKKYNSNVRAEQSIEHAIDDALASGYDAIVIFGSISFLGEAYLRLRGDYIDKI